MDIGMIVIHVANGTPVVARCEEATQGMRLVPATNAVELADEAARVLSVRGISLDEDGLYLSTDQLQAVAQFPSLAFPADAITFSVARDMLYPDVSSNTGWQRVRRDTETGLLRVWRVGIGHDVRRYVSRADVQQLAASRAEHATA